MTTNSERIKLLDVLINPGFDPHKEVERIMNKHPTATQEEIYAIALRDWKFVRATATQAVTDAMVAIKTAELKAA